ncbi:MAG TPA: hypothetical protein PLO67_02815, partial [Saprospiraceae bacterium]|nr:hypothetical protein [Saprospiraceae bacterium]
GFAEECDQFVVVETGAEIIRWHVSLATRVIPNFGAKRLRSSQIHVPFFPSATFLKPHRHIENIV